MRNLIIILLGLFIILPVMVKPALAFLREQDQQLVIETLNELQLNGAFEGQGAVSFDAIRCSKSARSCFLEFRAIDMQSDFGSIRPAKCVLENINSTHDVIDEDEKNKKNAFYPLTKAFVNSVKSCRGVISDDELDEGM
ncbi:MAG: hypothetical protein ACLGGX_09650 [Bdellovibrionia bacterium]